MKKIKSRITQGSGGIVSKYVKLMLVGYLFKKLKTTNISLPKLKEAKQDKESELVEKPTGSSMIMTVGEIILGVISIVAIIYAIKEYAPKSCWHRIQVK